MNVIGGLTKCNFKLQRKIELYVHGISKMVNVV
jgi:hypothetical protein